MYNRERGRVSHFRICLLRQVTRLHNRFGGVGGIPHSGGPRPHALTCSQSSYHLHIYALRTRQDNEVSGGGLLTGT